MWGLTSVIPAHRRLRQEECLEFQASLGQSETLLKKQNEKEVGEMAQPVRVFSTKLLPWWRIGPLTLQSIA